MVIHLPFFWMILLDFVMWFIFHMGISLWIMKVPDEWFAKTETGFRSRSWEKNGEIWHQLFRIRDWKKYLPDGSMIVKHAYNKTNLQGISLNSLEKFIIETKRAELTHWALIPPALLFFLWNPWWIGWCMVAYALVANLPFIVAQRYNRPRLERLYQVMVRREKRRGSTGSDTV